jgi:hypothetical protein
LAHLSRKLEPLFPDSLMAAFGARKSVLHKDVHINWRQKSRETIR